VEPETSAVLSVNFKSIDSRKIDAADGWGQALV